jgi:PKD repeat protein
MQLKKLKSVIASLLPSVLIFTLITTLDGSTVRAATGFVIDHTKVENPGEFIIDQAYLDTAREMDILFGHQSVGKVISYGEDPDGAGGGGIEDLANDPQYNGRYAIDLDGLNPDPDNDDIVVGWFDGDDPETGQNGIGEVHIGANYSPASKMAEFFDFVSRSDIQAEIDVAMMKFCYVDFHFYPDQGTYIWDQLQVDLSDGTTVYGYKGFMEYLESTFPNISFVWTTAPLTREDPQGDYGTNPDRADYNDAVRAYAATNGVILFDIADIESHYYDGSSFTYCYNETEKEYLCTPYVNGTGHPSADGAERLSRGVWWLLARIAGWDDGGATYEAPTAIFSSDVSGGEAPVTVTFDASASYDSDGTIVSYDWNFGDGNTGSGSTASHEYTTAGDFTVTLTVTDNDGATGTDSLTVNITENQIPVAVAASDVTSGDIPLAVNFDGSASYDTDGTIVNYDWDFGDGNTASGSTASNTYTGVGNYTVTLTVTDDSGATDSDTLTISAINSSGIFQEVNGQVVMEAEHYEQVIDRENPINNVMYSWDEDTSVAGYTGTAALQASPDVGGSLWQEYLYEDNATEARYRVNFQTAGTFYVWIRNLCDSGTSDSLHVGIDGVGSTSMDFGQSTSWKWSGNARTGGFAEVTVTEPGEHVINVWMREDGTRMDKIILTTTPYLYPSGDGPAETL